MKRIVFFDVDGTIYDTPNRYFSKKVAQAIHSIKEKGIYCVIATGRTKGFIPDEIKDIGFDGYVCANGAYLEFHNQVLKRDYLPYELVKNTVTQLKAFKLEYDYQSDEESYIQQDYKDLKKYFVACGINEKYFNGSFEEEDAMKKTLKMETYIHNEKEMELALSLSEPFDLEYSMETHHLEYVTPIHTKASSAIELLKYLDIPVENSYFFGDSKNDIELMKTVGHGFAMGNAKEEVKAYAQDVCLSVQEDGVAVKLKELNF